MTDPTMARLVTEATARADAAEAALAAAHERMREMAEGICEACDLLAERSYGSPARSPLHNARIRLESVLADYRKGNADG